MNQKIYPADNIRAYETISLFLVEDDDIDVSSLKRSLQKLKILNPLYRAKDGMDGLTMLRSGAVPSPYIILLDLNMPRMNGLEFLSELRADPNLTHAVVFVLTTSKSDEDLLSAYREHIAGYLLKQKMDSDFIQVVTLLDHFWRVVELPIIKK